MDLTKLRGVLAVLNLLAVVIMAGLGFWYAKELTTAQVTILMVPLMALTNELKVAYAFLFDGVAGKTEAPAAAEPTVPPTL